MCSKAGCCCIEKMRSPAFLTGLCKFLSNCDNAKVMKNFFVTYNKADHQWAEWIAWQLEGAGYTTAIQAWDFRPGFNFVLAMDKAAKESERAILVLSPDFLSSSFTAPEWTAAFVRDPKGENGLILPIKVRECSLGGLLASLSRIELVGLTEEEAKRALLDGVLRGRVKPKIQPGFPGQSQRSASEQTNFPGALPKGWNVPRRNKNFTAREDLLTRLRSALQSHQPVALHGLGGVGKTQLAMEYAYRYASEYNLVWWILAETPETLARDFSKISVLLNLPEKDSRNQLEIVEAVKSWLNRNPKWLLIFDNAKEPSEVGKYIPESTLGDVLITSRNPNWKASQSRCQSKSWKGPSRLTFSADVPVRKIRILRQSWQRLLEICL
jgi:hypothetical protein